MWSRQKNIYTENLFNCLSRRIELKSKAKTETTMFKDFLPCLTITVSTLDNLLLIKTW